MADNVKDSEKHTDEEPNPESEAPAKEEPKAADEETDSGEKTKEKKWGGIKSMGSGTWGGIKNIASAGTVLEILIIFIFASAGYATGFPLIIAAVFFEYCFCISSKDIRPVFLDTSEITGMLPD